MIDWTEIADGDTWELFARDFLADQGFAIEVGPGRGADAGRDLVVSEQLQGKFTNQSFKWLVSCKHNAKSGQSVGPNLETNLIDRVKQHKANGFIGFYSTLASSGLVERLRAITESGDIESHIIFDHKKIEGYFVKVGLSKLALQYFPQSYVRMRPIQNLMGRYYEMHCEVCGTDLLQANQRQQYHGNVIWASDDKKIVSVHYACKRCDNSLDAQLVRRGLSTQWQDVSDLVNPVIFLETVLSFCNELTDGSEKYSPSAIEQMKNLIIILSQCTLREMTEEDRERVRIARELEGF